jgi:hypothetical protein
MNTEPTNLPDFALRYTAAWCSHDPARVAAFYSAKGSLTVNGGTPTVGHEAIMAVAQEFITAFPDLTVRLDGLNIHGETAVYKWTLEGTNTGPGGTGKRVRIGGFEEWRIGADGLIAESKGHFDAAAYRQQLEEGVDQPK